VSVKTRKGRRIMAEWKQFVRRVILSVAPRALQNKHNSVPSRMDELIAAQGGAIRY